MAAVIHMAASIHADVLKHLFPKGDKREQGGFLFCQFDDDAQTFKVMEWMPLKGSDYAWQERDYLELSDQTRAGLIKKAHDMGACLVEIHCHPGQTKVAFSLADWMGFQDFVPHIRWRLAKKPYGALVYGYDCVDGFAWVDDNRSPISISGIQIGDGFLRSTENSIKAYLKGFYGSA
jgi:hypothetical protein